MTPMTPEQARELQARYAGTGTYFNADEVGWIRLLARAYLAEVEAHAETRKRADALAEAVEAFAHGSYENGQAIDRALAAWRAKR